MKTTRYITFVAFIFSNYAYASECEVPDFLKEGNKYRITLGLPSEDVVTVNKIDDDSCWIKISDKNNRESWVNIYQISVIRPEK
jgi:hypothetical protein